MRMSLIRGVQAAAVALLVISLLIACVDACQSSYQACGRRRQCCSGLNCSRDPGARPDETYCKEGTNSHNRLNTIVNSVQYAPYPWWAQDRSQRSALASVTRDAVPAPYPAEQLSYGYRIQPQGQQQYYY